MTDLSPAAQAVRDAVLATYADNIPKNDSLWNLERASTVAALKAAADQVVPDDITWASPKEQTRHYPSAEQRAGEQGMASVVRRRLLLIAAELEGADD